MRRIQFISIEEDDKDQILSFALDDGGGFVKSLLLHRTRFFEFIFDDNERGTKVSMEGDELDPEQESLNTLESFEFKGTVLRIVSRFRIYEIDASGLSDEDMAEIRRALEAQNDDDRFVIKG